MLNQKSWLPENVWELPELNRISMGDEMSQRPSCQRWWLPEPRVDCSDCFGVPLSQSVSERIAHQNSAQYKRKTWKISTSLEKSKTDNERSLSESWRESYLTRDQVSTKIGG